MSKITRNLIMGIAFLLIGLSLTTVTTLTTPQSIHVNRRISYAALNATLTPEYDNFIFLPLVLRNYPPPPTSTPTPTVTPGGPTPTRKPVVTPTPAIPVDGRWCWGGTTLDVANNGTLVSYMSIRAYVGQCGIGFTTQYFYNIPIVNNRISYASTDRTVTGQFSRYSSYGDYTFKGQVMSGGYPCNWQTSGSWVAEYPCGGTPRPSPTPTPTPTPPPGWQIQTVDSIGRVGWYTSIALDTNGYPHISYHDYSNGDLKYARWTGNTWAIQTVDSAGNVGQDTSIALDANGYPHISYYDYSNGDLKYARWTGNTWAIQTVDSAGQVGWSTSIALDTNGYPHISYHDYSNGDLKYARWTGSNWNVQTVDSYKHVGSFTSIALDANGYPHISYFYISDTALKYARWTGSSWNIQTVDNDGWVGQHTSIALDASGYPHISYYSEYPNYDLKYARWTGSSWNVQTVDSSGTVGKYTSIALDTNGYPHISYHYSGIFDDALKYARWTGSSWDIEAVDTVGKVGWFTSITLDNSDYPHISYYDDTNGDLKYARWTGYPPTPTPSPTPTADPTGWQMIVREDFEGEWPGLWVVRDRDGYTNGEYTWGKRSCRPYAGSYSGWAVGAGANGAGLACGSDYPNHAYAWMEYGPFSLENVSAAELKFKLWLNTEDHYQYDYLYACTSTNGSLFDCIGWSGNSGGWIDRTINLATFYDNPLGQPKVWIALGFSSDYSITYPEGVYVDDIVLRKCPTGITCSAVSTTSLSNNNHLRETRIQIGRTR